VKVERWNKIMDSFVSLLGFDEGVQTAVDIKRDMFANKYIYELNHKEDRRLIYRLRRLYENIKLDRKESKKSVSRRSRDNKS
jgi:hypothetical protein